MLTSNVQLGYVLTRGGGQAVQGGLSCPPPRISKRMDNQQFLLHHLIQKYLVKRDINFISVNLRCLLQTSSWVMYWQGVGGKLSRAVYLAPHLEFQRELIIPKFYYTICYRNICWKRYKHYFSQSEMLTSNVQLGYVLTRGGGQAVQGGLSCPPPRISKRMDNQQFLLHHLLQKYLVITDINFIPVNLRWSLQRFSSVTYWQGVGGKLSRAVYLAPHPEFQRIDNPQILLHHLLQEYLVERDINFISVNLRCLLQTFSWVMYWQGVGGKLSRAVYLAPPSRISERIDNPQILLHHLLQEYLVEIDININSINLRCSLQTFSWVTYWQGVGAKLSRAVYLAHRPEFQREWIISNFYYIIWFRNI